MASDGGRPDPAVEAKSWAVQLLGQRSVSPDLAQAGPARLVRRFDWPNSCLAQKNCGLREPDSVRGIGAARTGPPGTSVWPQAGRPARLGTEAPEADGTGLCMSDALP